MHVDWFGTAEELKEIDETVKKVCAETDGVEYKGRYSPLERKFHWTYVYELEDEDYGKMRKVAARAREISGVKIDKKKYPYASVSLFSGPYHK
jgi:hypothetical protein